MRQSNGRQTHVDRPPLLHVVNGTGTGTTDGTPNHLGAKERDMTPNRHRTIVITLSAALAAIVASAGPFDVHSVSSAPMAPTGMSGAADTGIQIQNLGTYPQDIDVRFGMISSGPVSSYITSNVFSSLNVYLPALPTLTSGVAYAVRMEGLGSTVPLKPPAPIAAIVRTDWDVSRAAAIYSNVQLGDSSDDVIVPLAVLDYFGQTSKIAIANDAAGSATSPFSVSFPPSTVTYPVNVKAGHAEFFSLTTVPGLTAGFLGTAVVKSSAPGVPFGVASFIDNTMSTKSVSAFEGVPASEAANQLFAPLVRARHLVGTKHFDTGISVVNVSSTSATVEVTYYGALGSCAGAMYLDGPMVIAPQASHVFYHGNPPISTSLPANCVASAVINSTGGSILAVVNDVENIASTYSADSSAAYNAVSASQGGIKVALPLVRHRHIPMTMKLTTGIQVMNISSSPANVSLSIVGNLGTSVLCAAACAVTIGSHQSHTWWPGSMSLPSSFVLGSGTVDSDQPVAIIVNDVSENGVNDMSTYNGIKSDVASGPVTALAPVAANGYIFP